MFNKTNNVIIIPETKGEDGVDLLMSKNIDNDHSDESKRRLAYIESLNQLRMHAPLIWKRNVFFTTFQGALIVYIFDQQDKLDFAQRGILCLLGCVGVISWYIITREGRNIQRQWRKLAIEKEKEYFGKLEGPLTTASLHIGEGNKLSVSITTVLLFMITIFIILWLIMIIQLVYEYVIHCSAV